ncbi:Fimbrial protein [Yersinia pekkanenii]|uniref:Fimbrial protein n=1 Tax=Yersinia pekkanenii TaxID=1288385 RepID=A0A0T9RJ36_9GAMM|nr:Fimbrial protein [Yersinia pekkanenii]CRY69795.1 Fimbrial protein [Yersinia pekkanenii]
MKINLFIASLCSRKKMGLLLLLLFLATSSKLSFAVLTVNTCTLVALGAGGNTPYVLKALPTTLTNRRHEFQYRCYIHENRDRSG